MARLQAHADRGCSRSRLPVAGLRHAPAPQALKIEPVMQVRNSAHQTAASYYQLGKFHQERGNLDQARAAYVQSIALDSRHLEARNALAAMHSQQGRLDEAKALLVEAVKDYPTVAQSYNNLGYVYYLKGDYKGAVAMLQRALDIDPGSERTRNNLEIAQAALARQESRGALADNTATAPTAIEGAAAPALAAQVVAPAVTASPVAALAPQPGMMVVQVAPQVYELKAGRPLAAPVARPQSQAPAPVTAPISIATPVPAAVQAPVAAPAPVAVQMPATSKIRPAASPQAEPAAARPARFKLEVANGNGVNGMAARIRQVLVRHGIATGRLTNQRPYRQQETEIQYRTGYASAAHALKTALQGHAVLKPADTLPGNSDVRLVLGKDVIGNIAAIDRSPTAPGNLAALDSHQMQTGSDL